MQLALSECATDGTRICIYRTVLDQLIGEKGDDSRPTPRCRADLHGRGAPARFAAAVAGVRA